MHEGIVPAPYRDSVRVWTYGVGHTAAAGAPVPEKMPRGMPADLDAALREVFAVLRRDLTKYEMDVDRAVTVPVTQAEFDALVSFHYNTGGIFKAQLTKALNAGDRPGAIKGFMGWVKPPEIIPRREAEQSLFANGVYPGGTATVWGVTEGGSVIWRAQRRLTMPQVLALLAAAPLHTTPVVPSKPPEPAHKPASAPVAPAVAPVAPVPAKAPWWAPLATLLAAIARLNRAPKE